MYKIYPVRPVQHLTALYSHKPIRTTSLSEQVILQRNWLTPLPPDAIRSISTHGLKEIAAYKRRGRGWGMRQQQVDCKKVSYSFFRQLCIFSPDTYKPKLGGRCRNCVSGNTYFDTWYSVYERSGYGLSSHIA
jgi:hypothetical protein